MLTAIECNGYSNHHVVLCAEENQQLLRLLEHAPIDQGRGGFRDVMTPVPELRKVADSQSVRALVNSILGPEAFVVRATLFDKTDASNWNVPWHQDLTIAVQKRVELEGFNPWSTKEGVVHVQPPSGVLERMLTVRIHLDPCPATNGALRVMPGTHKLGRLNQNDVTPYVDEALAVTCEAEAGEALVMRPLLLHASSASQMPTHRRVLHFDFAADSLPSPLKWMLR